VSNLQYLDIKLLSEGIGKKILISSYFAADARTRSFLTAG